MQLKICKVVPVCWSKCQLEDGRLVKIEVQRADDDDHQRRVRYNGALLTTNLTNPSTKFAEIPDVIVVFISKFDVFKSSKTLYHIDRVIRETGKAVDNGFEEVYVNAEIDDDSDVARLMNVFNNDIAYDDEKFPVTSAYKRRYKNTEEGVREMCEVIERNRAEGRAEGLIEGKAELITNMLKNQMKPEQIAKIANMTVEQIISIGKKAAVL